MKYKILLISLIISSITAFSQETKPQNAVVPFDKKMFYGVSRLFVQNDSGIVSGTVFIARYRERIYAITAAHIFAGYHSGDILTVKIDDGLKIFDSNIQVFISGSSDVAVFLYNHWSNSMMNELFELQQAPTIRVSDPVLYLGYPATNLLNASVPIQSIVPMGRRIPLVKRGYLSGEDFSRPETELYIIDTQNLTGFSGSPLYIMNGNKLQIVGIMCGGYNANVTQVQNNKQKTLGDTFYLSGLSYAFSINHAIEIIDQVMQ